MDKTKIFRYLLLPLLFLSYIDSYSQESFGELVWTNRNSIETVILKDTNQIKDWGKGQLDFSLVRSKEVVINNTEVFVVLISGCSGLPCWKIFAFRKIEKAWHLTAKANLILGEEIEIDADFSQKKILFTTKSGVIGELPFEVFD